MKTIGSSMSTITLKNTPNYWGASAKAVPKFLNDVFNGNPLNGEAPAICPIYDELTYDI